MLCPLTVVCRPAPLQVIVARYPASQFWLERHFDELFLVVNALFQRHYLFTYG